MPMTKPTSEQVTFLAAGTGAQQRTALDKMRETVSVKDFGAVGDGVADDTAAIQAAVNHAISQKAELHLPGGRYLISSPIQWTGRLVMRGIPVGTGHVEIVAVAAINAVIQASTNPADFGITRWSHISGLSIVCNGPGGSAAYGIQGATAYSVFENCYIQGATGAAIQVFSAIDCDFRNLWLAYNADGLHLSNTCNQCSIVQCKTSINSGFGMRITGSSGILISGCLIESNQRGGMYLQSVNGFHISGCYFGNFPTGSAGHTFTSPVTYNVKADIIVNGAASLTTIAGGFDSKGGVIAGNYTETAGDCFVFGPGLRQCSIHGNSLRGSSAQYPIVRFYGNNSPTAHSLSFGSAFDIDLGPNFRFINAVDIDQAANTAYNVSGASIFRNKCFGVASQNIAETDFSRWSSVFTADGGTFARSSEEFFANPDVPVWRLSISSGPFASNLFGFDLDASKYARYHDKWMAFGVWVKGSQTNGRVDVIARGTSTNSSNTDWSQQGWYLYVTAFKMPTTGTVRMAIRGSVPSGEPASTVDVAAPVICELGADFNALWGAYGRQVEFFGTAAPSAGTWKRGDIVWNTTPSGGGDPGWVCVAAGTPGTWKAMANLDA